MAIRGAAEPHPSGWGRCQPGGVPSFLTTCANSMLSEDDLSISLRASPANTLFKLRIMKNGGREDCLVCQTWLSEGQGLLSLEPPDSEGRPPGGFPFSNYGLCKIGALRGQPGHSPLVFPP